MAQKTISTGNINVTFRVRYDVAIGWVYDIEITDTTGNFVGRGGSYSSIQDAVSTAIAAVNQNVASHDTTLELAQAATSYLNANGASELSSLKSEEPGPPPPAQPSTPALTTETPANGSTPPPIAPKKPQKTV